MWVPESVIKRYIVIAAVLSSLITGLLFFTFQIVYINNVITEETQQYQQQLFLNTSVLEEQIISSIIDSIKDSVVHVTTTTMTRDFFFRPVPVEGTGTGFIVRNDGYIVTNNHVVSGATSVKVVLSNGKEYEATVVGTDPMTDTAVIKIDAKGLKPVIMGDSDKLKPGQIVIAIGNPYRLDNTVTLGVVSALNRTIETEEGYKMNGVIQTDAAINPGNSGGPLINMNGEVIGINTAIYTTTGAYQGIGFSIPINTVKKVVNEIIEKGKVTRPWLGITGRNVDPELAEAFGIPIDYGALIVDIVKDGPAYKAGLRGTIVKNGLIYSLGDIIVKFDGRKIDSMDTLIEAIQAHDVGDEVEIEYLRNGVYSKVTLRLGERP
jgi:S1-C subfamily serine protease